MEHMESWTLGLTVVAFAVSVLTGGCLGALVERRRVRRRELFAKVVRREARRLVEERSRRSKADPAAPDKSEGSMREPAEELPTAIYRVPTFAPHEGVKTSLYNLRELMQTGGQ